MLTSTVQHHQTAALALQVDHLTQTVTTMDGPLTILADITFNLAKGESLAIVGASGSGKSTLLGLLAGLDSASSGQVHMAGVELGGLDEERRALLRAAHVGFVFQSFQLLPALNALENVMLPLEMRGHPEALELARHWLAKVGLADRGKHYPRQLSGGEQQRVAIARAFASSPSILFADEPTGNLDSATGGHIIDLLFDLNRDQGTTLVLVTHDEALASRCSRRLRLRAGRMSALEVV